MRTKKKNESGILNQNLCGSNLGYSGRQDGDPIGGGYTFANVAYPGKKYNIGSTFREQDMGNLLQLVFQCDQYFRHKNIELITDSHFGHLVPVAFCRLWGIHCTSSALVSRKGLSKISFLSKKKLTKEEIKVKLEANNSDEVKEMKSFDPFSNLESSEDDKDEEQILDYAEQKPKKKGLRTECAFYEQKLMTKPKGSYEVYKTNFSVGEHFNTPVYLHVVWDSKVVYRISTKYAAKPSVPLSIVVKVKNKKSKVTAQTSEAHKTFRNQLGHNDQSDGKRALIGLSSRYYKRWPQKPFAKNWEDGLINSYLNYLLDPGCPTES